MDILFCREEVTRTPDPYVPNVVRYQLRYFSSRERRLNTIRETRSYEFSSCSRSSVGISLHCIPPELPIKTVVLIGEEEVRRLYESQSDEVVVSHFRRESGCKITTIF